MTGSIIPLIRIDEQRCNNCRVCLSVCPVKFCIDGSGPAVSMNHELCIGCGRCLATCRQKARTGICDAQTAFDALSRGEPMIALAEPSLIASFAGRSHRLISWLRSKGVGAVFDASFGAELTVKSYLDVVERKNPEMVIAQPCPAVVSYVEIFHPELIPCLAPVDSPNIHSLKMIREFYPLYKDHRIMVLSSCIAKKREFAETGFEVYNVTLSGLNRQLESEGADLSHYEEGEFENPPPERGALVSSVGGLTKLVLRERHTLAERIRRVEGEDVFPYLDGLEQSIRSGTHPLLLDCRSCAKGCNAGTGTDVGDKPVDELEMPVARRAEGFKKIYRSPFTGRSSKGKIRRAVEPYWKRGLYDRSYRDQSERFRTIRMPDEEALQIIYRNRLLKRDGKEDILNCTTCGYNSCEMMAAAIYNGLNKAENCHLCVQRMVEIKHEEKLKLVNEKRILRLAHAETRKILDHIQQGLLIINKDLSIVGEYSRSVHTILQTSIIEGRPVASLFFPHDSERYDELNEFLTMMFQNTHSAPAMFAEINPLKAFTLKVPSKRKPSGYEERHLSVDFNRFETESEQNIMMLISDNTRQYQMGELLNEEKQKKDREADIISILIKHNTWEIEEFIMESSKLLMSMKVTLTADAHALNDQNYKRYAADLHSQKGIAQVFGCDHVARMLHGLESRIQDLYEETMLSGLLSSEEKREIDTIPILEDIEEIIDELFIIDELCAELRDAVRNFDRQERNSWAKLLSTLRDLVNKGAETHGKKIRFRCRIDPALISDPLLNKLRIPLIHLINNSIDHGIEPPVERLLCGKAEEGSIELTIRKAPDGSYEILLKDDGCGIDTEILKKRLLKENRIAPQDSKDEKKILKNIFTHGVSTKDSLSMTSGRGVGLAAVAQIIHNDLKGKIRLQNNCGKGIIFRIQIPETTASGGEG